MKAAPTQILLLLATGASVILGVPSALQASSEQQISADDLRTILKEAKLEFVEDEDEEKKTTFEIEIADDDATVMYQYGGKGDAGSSLQMVYVVVPEKAVDWKQINAWNENGRYTKAYLSDDVVFLEQDLDLAAGYSKKAIEKFITDFNKTSLQFSQYLSGD